MILVVFPTFTFAEVLVSLRDGFLTVTLHVALYSPHVAVITAVPFAFAVITPLLFTVAIIRLKKNFVNTFFQIFCFFIF